VPEQRTTSLDGALVAALADRDALLVVDNCEHVVDGVRACVELIVAGCPRVTVLATSRIRLLVPYERVFMVPGLSVDDEGGDAVDLFAARAAAASGDAALPDAARVAALCRALDGMALAIELAAARFPVLGLDGLESALDHRMRMLSAGSRRDDRHASLRSAIAWSHDLLSDEDRALLRRVAPFASWFDVDAAHAVAGDGLDRAEIADGLARLAEHSLLVVERGEPTRYRALEAIRQYGVERLAEAGELDRIRAAHERFCRQALAALRGTAPADIDDAWCAGFDRIVDDVGAALAWSAADETRRGQAATLAADLAGLLFLRGRPAQAQRRFERAAELAATPAERVANLRLAAGAAASRYVGDEALRLYRAAADAAIAAGDRRRCRARPGDDGDVHRPSARNHGHPAPADGIRRVERRGHPLSDGSPSTRAALAVRRWGDAPSPGAVPHAVELAERAGDGVLHSIALDLLTAADLVGERHRRRGAGRPHAARPCSTSSRRPARGFEHGDGR
jgi:predicted ATPase